LCAQFATQRLDRNAVDKGALAADLEDRQPLAIRRLEGGIAGDVDGVVCNAFGVQRLSRLLAEVAAVRGEEDDACRYG
jgi:hypothetical protein